MKIILASQSPMRKELLKQMGLEFEVLVSNADETFEEGLSLEEQSKRLAYIKAKTVFDETEDDRIIIGSDTMVLKDGEVFGKPKNKQDAIDMLNKLKNTCHTAITSLCVLVEKNGECKKFLDYDTTKVFFKNMTEEEILHWIKIGNPYEKAGAYELASPFCVFVDKIEGNITTVQGLPTHKLYEVLKQLSF
ncbi:MAG: septum formation protein Maf [Clostridia bacterium]|nr:septum formation protein Maf [Clostridia bacterium]